MILHIETATKNCSVALAEQGKLIHAIDEYSAQYTHAERLHPLIAQLLQEANYKLSDIKAIAVGKGPGSYTGLRIGVSATKGLCFGLKIPLIAIDTLTILSQPFQNQSVDYIIPMLDARRMEVYTAVFQPNGELTEPIKALIVEENSFAEYNGKKVIFAGDGVEKCKHFLTDSSFTLAPEANPSARDMVTLAYQKFLTNDFEDVAYFEPFYLKDFIALPAKKLL